jgi:hypothetical protein
MSHELRTGRTLSKWLSQYGKSLYKIFNPHGNIFLAPPEKTMKTVQDKTFSRLLFHQECGPYSFSKQRAKD